MTIKSILCIFGGADSELGAVNAALALGKEHGAHIRFLHLSPDPSAYAGLYGEGIIVSGEIVEAIEKENKTRLEKARRHVTALAGKHHVPLDAPESPAHHASATFRHLTGMMDASIARAGRVSDLIVLGKDDKPTHDIITPALFNTGRPVLLMPALKDDMAGWRDKMVALAWDGSLQAARSLYNALPVIRNAEAVQVLVSREHRKPLDLEAEQDIMEYLRAHGLKPNVIVTDRGSHSIGEALLAKAKELNADLLVLGAYGHSMFREMILGGVTEYMLEHADIPLLLSH